MVERATITMSSTTRNGFFESKYMHILIPKAFEHLRFYFEVNKNNLVIV